MRSSSSVAIREYGTAPKNPRQPAAERVNWTAMARPSIPLLAAAGLALAAAPAQAAPTGRVLVLLHRADGARAQASAVQAFLARTGARRAGPQVPEIGLVTVRLPAGRSFAGFARALRRDGSARSVQPEGRMTLRAAPN